MSEVLEMVAIETEEHEGIDDVGSLNHSAAQANLAYLFKRLDKYSVFTELSLDIRDVDLTPFDLQIRSDVKVDVCIYPKRPINPAEDILRVKEMPLLAVEIISPRQGISEITEKFKLYFSLGIQSCWLVIPNNQTVTVYADMAHFSTFVSGDVIDNQLEIRLPVQDIFE